MEQECDIADRLRSLTKLNKAALWALWRELYPDLPICKLRKETLVRALAYRMQEQAFGGLDPKTIRRLQELARSFRRNPKASIQGMVPLKPGTRLIREWQGQSHVVTIVASGYEYRGTDYRSLSEIACHITGTRWSGPLFFGLKDGAHQNRKRP